MSGIRQLSFKLVPSENATELLNAQAHIWNHIFNFVNSMSLKRAIELGIPDIIHNHGKHMTLWELIIALPIHPTKSPHVKDLMRILIHYVKTIATLVALEIQNIQIMRKKKELQRLELQRLTSSKHCRIEDWENIKER